MREQYYQRRLVNDLEKWVEQGRISQENAEDIISDLPSSGLAERLPSVIAILGAVLICFGILAFVAANWYGVPKYMRLALLGVGMWAAYGCAGILHKRGSVWLFEATVLIGVSIYTTGIVLIAQMYHMDGHYPDAIIMAGAGALLAAWLLRSTSALVIAFAMITLWTHMEIFDFDAKFHWPFLIAWCGLTAIAYLLKSRLGYHLATVSFGYWVTVTAFTHIWFDGGAMALLAGLGFIVLSIALIFAHHIYKETPDSFACALSRYAITALVTLIFFIQINEPNSYFASVNRPGGYEFYTFWFSSSAALVAIGILISILWRQKTGYTTSNIVGLILLGITAPLFSITGADGLQTLIPLAISVFLISLWLITFGQDFADRNFINLGFVLFGGEALYIYFKMFGTLMNSFVFFTIGGIILILLALGLDRFRKRILEPAAQAEGEV